LPNLHYFVHFSVILYWNPVYPGGVFVSEDRPKRKRKFKPAKRLNPSEVEVNRVREALRKYYTERPHLVEGYDSIDDRINEVIEKAKEGYTCAPKTFIGRIKALVRWSDIDYYVVPALSGDTSASFTNWRARKIAQVLKQSEKALYPGLSAKELRASLGPGERKFWIEREKKYREEYDLNDSSDWPLLMQVLLEEITQRRLTLKKLKDPEADLEDELNNSYKRLINALKALGITREQRRKDYDQSSENIASLSVRLEEKLKRIAALKEKDALEENELMRKHQEGGVLKQLPEELRNIMEDYHAGE
jgi:hypothetical protein